MTTLSWIISIFVSVNAILYLIGKILEGKDVRIRYEQKIPRWLSVAGITLYPWILFESEPHRVSRTDVKHEFVHAEQVLRKGHYWFYLSYLLLLAWVQVRYLFGALADPTDKHPYEIEAYAKEKGELRFWENEIWKDSLK